jgi:hypothetical protein
MAFVMLALVPVGLAVLFWGMHKSPLWGTLGLGLVWTDLSHWGFLSFVGAVGLQMMSVGLALRLVVRPTRRLKLALTLCLLAVLFTHVFRFPFAIVSVLLAAAVVAPTRRALRELSAPLLVALVPFALWLALRPPGLRPELALGPPDLGRLTDFGSALIGSFHGDVGDREQRLARQMLALVVALAGLVGLARVLRFRQRQPIDPFRLTPTAAVLLLAVVHVLAFLTLPQQAGQWWYIYPREALPAALFALAALPELGNDAPHWAYLRLGAVVLIAVAAGRMAHLVATEYRAFHEQTSDFRAIVARVPRAPKLLYLVFDHTGVANKHSPYLHLPAWVQADKGGWLSFHFAAWGIFPLRYRSDGIIPPPFELGWEWQPQHFRVERATFFDTFLVRHRRVDPAPLFARDPSIQLIAHIGDWWLYRRVAAL